MLPSQYRMHCSTEFSVVVKHGQRAVQPHLILYSYVLPQKNIIVEPQVGFIVARYVGNSVQRHRIARQLRHVMRDFISELIPHQRIVIRVRSNSCYLSSREWAHQIQSALSRVKLTQGDIRC